ncbi:MAG TPA: type II secretion system protein [Patescibacteria group bacterium]|jgi:prepilin-type N-terminal cleavage/methylation domain-containing protein|nr:type II secretion system protein [Patescibacteria group bacterium]
MVKNKERGFTLIELLVVISIIGLLATILLVSLNTSRVKARNSRRIADAHQLVVALQLYLSDNASMMSCGSEDSTTATWSAGCLPTALAPYMVKLPKDPTNNATYKYIVCSEGSGCNTSYTDSRYYVQIFLETSGASQTFFVYAK